MKIFYKHKKNSISSQNIRISFREKEIDFLFIIFFDEESNENSITNKKYWEYVSISGNIESINTKKYEIFHSLRKQMLL